MKQCLALCTAILILLTAAAAACGGNGEASKTSFVYVMTNASSGNSVIVFQRSENGSLEQAGSVGTQGKGSGSSLNPLNSQGALVLTGDNKWVLAVNSGSNEISILSVSGEGLNFAGKTSSLGQSPISISSTGNLAVVLNQKSTPPNIASFSIDKAGVLTPVSGGVRSLPPGDYSQVSFSPNGKWLILAGESHDLLLMYSVNGNNLGADPVVVESSGRAPAAFAFDSKANLIVAEADDNSVSTYAISGDTLKAITKSLPVGQRMPRWITAVGNYVYAVNLGSDNISSFALSATVAGQLTLLNTNAASAAGPTELAASSDGKYLYVLDPGSRAIHIYVIGADGGLETAGTVIGLFGISAQGIAAS